MVGTALTPYHLREAAYTTAAKEHDFVTPENETKRDAVERSRNNFTYGAGDQIVSFANENGMKVKGHTLV